MTYDELIEAMARAICRAATGYDPGSIRSGRSWGPSGEWDAEFPAWMDYVDEARAALAVADPVIRERCARVAEKEAWNEEAHPESIYGSACLKIAASIRKGSRNDR